MSDLNQRIQQGLSALNNGDAKTAARIFRQVLLKSPKDSELLHLTAMALIQSDKKAAGRKYLNKSLELSPENADANNTLGVLLREDGKIEQSIKAFSRAVQSDPGNVRALKNLGRILTDSGQSRRALDVFRQLAAKYPGDADTLGMIGANHMYLGAFDAAITSLRQALSIEPAHGNSWLLLSDLDKNIPDSEIDVMQQQLEDAAALPANRELVAAALFRVFERRKNVLDAGKYLILSNQIRRAGFDYDVNDDAATMVEIANISTIDDANSEPRALKTAVQPIFVLGLPRSGTTLVEQILSSHSAVAGAGECNSVLKAIKEVAGRTDPDYPQLIRHWKKRDYEKLGKAIERILQEAGKGRSFVIDKTTDNYLYIGLIKRLWPDARIIHCQRNLMDCAWSNYKTPFREGYPHAFEQSEIVHYFRAKEKLMQHWREAIPGGFLDIQYEDVVSSQEKQTRRLLEYCGLPWEDACLDFHQNERAVQTASAAQIRSPIYKSSLKAWEPYRGILTTLTEGLMHK
jgi:Flp pilus assembly protein TadD